MKITREKNNIAMVLVDEKYYVVAINRAHGQVYSTRFDNPSDGGAWFARWSDEGVKYVATAISRSTAYRRFAKLAQEATS